MTFILIINLILLVAALFLLKKHAAARPIAVVLAITTISIVMFINIRGNVHPARAEELRYQESVGYMLGKTIAEKHPNGGTFAVLNMPVFSSKPTLHTAKMDGLSKALKSKSFNLSLLDLNALPMPLEDFFNRLEGGYQIPEFWNLMSQVPGAAGVISLVGLPPPPDDEWSNIPVYAAGASISDDEKLEENWPGLTAFVRTKPDIVIRQPPPKGSMEVVFASRYELIMP